MTIAYFCLIDLSKSVPKYSFPNIDKVVHFFFYLVLSYLLFLFFKDKGNNTLKLKVFLYPFLISVAFGILIEIFQEIFTTTRSADVYDVLANSFGTFIAISIGYLSTKKPI